MHLWENELYQNDIKNIVTYDLPWRELEDKTILVSGATGMIGSCLIDALVSKDLGIKIIAVGRNEERARRRFFKFWNDRDFKFIKHDINEPLPEETYVDYIVHTASNTHPKQYSTDPIGTVTTNIIGANNLLNYATKYCTKRFVYVSSNEIYGENRGDVEKFNENYCGYINSNTLRAGYPESKRAGEALCQAFIKQKRLDITIPRLTRTYGPTMLHSDSKAISQFIKNGINKEDVILKSDGSQFFSFTYVADAITALLTVLLKGKCGEAYNVSDESSDKSLKEIAKIIADLTGTKVVHRLPDAIEATGYSKATRCILDSRKLQSLGWKAMYNINNGLERTMCILEDIEEL